MVNENNKRVMITCSPKMLKNIQELQRYYDVSITQLIKLLVAKEVAERELG